MPRFARIAVLALVVTACLLQASPVPAQIMVVDQWLYVTEVRPEKNRIGISQGRPGKTRGWVKVEGKTRVYRRNGRASSQGTMWRSLRRGMRIRVHGGGDWDTNVVARSIWY